MNDVKILEIVVEMSWREAQIALEKVVQKMQDEHNLEVEFHNCSDNNNCAFLVVGRTKT